MESTRTTGTPRMHTFEKFFGLNGVKTPNMSKISSARKQWHLYNLWFVLCERWKKASEKISYALNGCLFLIYRFRQYICSGIRSNWLLNSFSQTYWWFKRIVGGKDDPIFRWIQLPYHRSNTAKLSVFIPSKFSNDNNK